MTGHHTPTPWETGCLMNKVEVLPNGWNVPMCIADCGAKNSPESNDEQCANAEFIVRAANCHDELLTATKKALRRMMTITNSYPTKHADKMLIAQLGKAIAQATGASS